MAGRVADSRNGTSAAAGFITVRRGTRHFLQLTLAVIFIVIGLFLVFLPGPAILFFALAVGILANQFKVVARLLDWIEIKVRKIFSWGKGQWDGT